MDPSFLPAWRLAELICAGAIGCVELLDHFIARVEQLDSRTNAVVVRDFDRARDHARRVAGAAWLHPEHIGAEVGEHRGAVRAGLRT